MTKKKRVVRVSRRTPERPSQPLPKPAMVIDEPLVRGPRKATSKGAPAPRFTTHKARAVWFQERASYPVREAEIDTLTRERARAAALPQPPLAAPLWELVGPTNIGGRVTSLVAHPNRPDAVYVGAAGGGVWKSEDAGRSWKALWHQEPVLNVGALAIDATAPDTLYCATGEANGSADSYAGVGLFKTLDAGATWTLIAPAVAIGLPRRIGTIAIDPFDSTHIRLGGTSHDPSDPSAMFTSRDGGLTWAREHFISAANYWCHAIVFHPTRRDVIFAAVDENGAKNGIWRTEDGGRVWTRLSNGLPAGSAQFGRTSLAIAPSAPDTMYALVASGDDRVLGVFRSADMGTTWSAIHGAHFRTERQMTYGNTIVVHPTNPNWVLCGGVDLHLTTNGGVSWRKVTRWDRQRGQADYAHADHHALLMPAAAVGRVYDGNDGGMDYSDDGGLTWANRSNGLSITMYYDLDVGQSDGRTFGGGTQDNGTNLTTTGSADDHSEILGGDGGWMVIDPSDARRLYASYYNMNIHRFRAADGWADVSPPEDAAVRNAMWMVYIAMDPVTPTTVFTGAYRVWKTVNDGRAWKAVSPTLDGSPITAIEVATARPDCVYIGTQKGGFFRSLDGGRTWSGSLAGATLPGRIITRIEAHPLDPLTVVITVGGMSVSRPFSHVFLSTDAGTTWRDIDNQRLPNVPHQALAFQTDAPGAFYVASDAGVFYSPDLGGTWLNISRNLPNVMMVDLVYHERDRTLTAATYGRSLWRVRVS